MSLGSQSSFFLGSSGAGGDSYKVERSLRFNPSDNAHCSRTPSSAGNQKTFTLSFWAKLCDISSNTNYIYTAGSGSPGGLNSLEIGFDLYNRFFISEYGASVSNYYVDKTSAYHRDPSAWYHFILAVDTTQATATNRVKFYVNGVEQTKESTSYPFPQNRDTAVNSTTVQTIGSDGASDLDGYLADIHFIDGQALAATDFGEFDSNSVWQPKAFEGTYGTNGFKLDFSDISSNAALGTDTSGNSNTWTVNNLIAATTVSPTVPVYNTYVDYVMGFYLNGPDPLYLTKQPDGTSVADNLSHGVNSGTDWEVDDVVQWAIDKDNSKLWLGLNNTWYSGDPSTATDPGMANLGTSALFLGLAYNSPDMQLEVATTSAYTPPTGYTYWSAAETGSWVGSGTSTSNVSNDIFNTAIPTSGKIYIEAKIKGGVSTFANVGLMNLGITRVQGDALRDSPANGDSANDTGAGGELTGSYCTFNPLQSKAGGYTNTYAEGNLQFSGGGDGTGTVTFGSGKKYFELTCTSAGGFSQGYYGIVQTAHGDPRTWATSEVAAFRDAGVFYGDSSTGSAPAAITVAGGVYGFAVDVDNQKMYISVDGSWLNSGDPASGTGASFTGRDFSDYVPLVSLGAADTQVWTLNTGQSLFTHSAPSGFKPLCTATITESTVPNGLKEFDSNLWSGTGATQVITNNVSTSLVWVKDRGPSPTSGHKLEDIVRGAGKYLSSNTSGGQVTPSNGIDSFNSNGYTLGTDNAYNGTGHTFVGWSWNVGSSNTTIAVGGLNSSLYDQSQTWSGGSTSGTLFSGNFTEVFNGVITQTYSDGNSAYVYQNSATYTFPSPITGTIEVWVRVGGSGASGDNVTVTDGTTVYSTGDITNQTAAYVSLNNGNSISGITSITVNSGASSGAGMVLGAIKLTGKMLVDSAVTPPNVPTIESTVRANPSAGVSIVSYTATASTGSIAHGLNAAPDFVLCKRTDTTGSWWAGHVGAGWTEGGYLQVGDAFTALSGFWNDTAPDSNIVTLGAYPTDGSPTATYISYCFTSVNGFSKQGKYVGNGEATDGPFVFTGFRVAFLLLKGIDGAHYWAMHDSARNPYNTNDFEYLWANDAGGTGTGYDLDFLSNGFKIRNSNGNWNNSGQEYIYIAFASHPFQTARAR